MVVMKKETIQQMLQTLKRWGCCKQSYTNKFEHLHKRRVNSEKNKYPKLIQEKSTDKYSQILYAASTMNPQSNLPSC